MGTRRDDPHQQAKAGAFDAAIQGLRHAAPRSMTVDEIERASGAMPGVAPFRDVASVMKSIVGGGGCFGGCGSQAFAPADAVAPTITPMDIRDTASTWVDIFLSAGPHEGYGADGDVDAAAYRSCNAGNKRNCSLFRVRFDFTLQDVVAVMEVAAASSTASFIQPSVSPDGTGLAYIRLEGDAANASLQTQDVLVASTTEGLSPVDVVSGVRDGATFRPAFPEWYDNDTLLYHGELDNVNPAEGTLWRVPASGGSAATALRGPGTAVLAGYQFQDVEVSRQDQDRIVAHTDDLSGNGPYPMVSSLSDPTQVEEFERPLTMGEGGPAQRIAECHHPSWNPSGERILCMQNDPIQAAPGHLSENKFRLLYQFEKGPVKWEVVGSNGGVMFLPMEAAAYEATGVFPMDSAQAPFCRIMSYKYAQWCGRNNYLVVTVYCEDNVHNARTPHFTSRVMLIRYDGAVPVYWDLTDLIRQVYFPTVEKINFQGIFATCQAGYGESTPAAPLVSRLSGVTDERIEPYLDTWIKLKPEFHEPDFRWSDPQVRTYNRDWSYMSPSARGW